MAHDESQFYFNPFDPGFRANPYPHYRALLAGPPRKLTFYLPTVLAARYDDVAAVLKDPEHFSSVQPKIPGLEQIQQEFDPFGGAPTMLFSDPPVHTRLRRLVSRAFTPRRVRDLEAPLRQLTCQLLDKVAAAGEFEAMEDLANPLPVMVISEMLGVPAEHYPNFKSWSDEIVAADNAGPGMPLPDSARQASKNLRAYFAAEIDRRRSSPADDLVSALVAAHQEAEALTADELLAFVVLLLLAGNETTTNLIGNGLLALSHHPDQLERLRRQPELITSAIEEMLRYDGPVQSTARHAIKDANLGGTEVVAGTMVFAIVAAANRDPAQFKDPETFDIARQPNEHIAFGEGIHYCIGAALARLEGAVAISSVLERFPRLRLADPAAPLTYKGSFFLRGLSQLPMKI